MTAKEQRESAMQTILAKAAEMLDNEAQAIYESQDCDGKSTLAIKAEIEWLHPPKGRVWLVYQTKQVMEFACDDPNQGRLEV